MLGCVCSGFKKEMSSLKTHQDELSSSQFTAMLVGYFGNDVVQSRMQYSSFCVHVIIRPILYVYL